MGATECERVSVRSTSHNVWFSGWNVHITGISGKGRGKRVEAIYFLRIFFPKRKKKDTGQLNCTGRNEKFFVLQQKDADMHLETFPNLKPDLQLQDKLIRIT